MISATALGRDFTRLLGARVASSLGTGVFAAAIPLLTASLTRNPALVAAVGFAQAGSWMISGLVGGTLADRRSRRGLLIALVLVRAALLAGLGALTFLRGDRLLAWIYVWMIGLAATEAMAAPVDAAILPAIVTPDQMQRANGRLVGIDYAGRAVVGPSLGAVLFGISAAVPFVSSAIGFVAAAAGLSLLAEPSLRRPPSTEARARPPIAEAITWLRAHGAVTRLALIAALAMFSFWLSFPVLVLYVERVLRLEHHYFGVFISLGGLGAIAAGLLAGRLSPQSRSALVLWSCVAIQSAGAFAVAAFVHPAVMAVVSVTNGLSVALVSIVVLSAFQVAVPAPLVGRVAGLVQTLVTGAMALGALVGAVIGLYAGVRGAFHATGIVSAALLVVGAVLLRRRR